MIIPGEKESGSIWNWRSEKDLFKKLVLELFRKWKNLKNICCTKAERSQQLRIEELSRQEKASKSTVNQLTVQIQELQDRK